MSKRTEKSTRNTQMLTIKICGELLRIIKMRQTSSKEVNISMQMINAESLTSTSDDIREAI